MSLKLGEAHPQQEAFYLSLGESASGEFDIDVMEQNYKMDPERYAKPMRKHHRVFHAAFGEEDLGLVAIRHRLVATALNMDTIVWLGAPGEDQTRPFFFFSGMALRANNARSTQDNYKKMNMQQPKVSYHIGESRQPNLK